LTRRINRLRRQLDQAVADGAGSGPVGRLQKDLSACEVVRGWVCGGMQVDEAWECFGREISLPTGYEYLRSYWRNPETGEYRHPTIEEGMAVDPDLDRLFEVAKDKCRNLYVVGVGVYSVDLRDDNSQMIGTSRSLLERLERRLAGSVTQ
jgi:hypothetical protein